MGEVFYAGNLLDTIVELLFVFGVRDKANLEFLVQRKCFDALPCVNIQFLFHAGEFAVVFWIAPELEVEKLLGLEVSVIPLIMHVKYMTSAKAVSESWTLSTTVNELGAHAFECLMNFNSPETHLNLDGIKLTHPMTILEVGRNVLFACTVPESYVLTLVSLEVNVSRNLFKLDGRHLSIN